jgi:polyphosphate kinase 2 (PPK2 family)
MPRLPKLRRHAKLKDKKKYEERLRACQLRLLELQQRYYHERRRAVVVFEGPDAAGKGGAIRRLAERLDPRGIKVYPIGAPLPEEQGRHYLWRFWTRLPPPGEIAVFDRSWYGRMLVERVFRLAPKEALARAAAEINAFEKMLAQDGCRLVKIYLHITKDEQLRRFHERERNPYKRWKIGPEDWRNRRRWRAFERAAQDMLGETDTRHARWHVVAGNHKWYARTEVLRHVVRALAR